MNFDDISEELGPLPESDENARLQRESFKALDRFLSRQDTFVFRDERIEDFGIDGSIELNIGGRMTNFRAQIQLKSMGKVEQNSKGYVSYSIETSNLNHLLNGTCPMYLLWDESRDEFWRVWAQDEHRRLISENPRWREQKTVTLQFREKFEAASFPAVKERILTSGRLLRKIHDSLARATEDEQVVIRIDSGSLEIDDSNVAASILLASGTAIIAAGYPKRVIELMDLVDPGRAALPRMQLTRGYAEYVLGYHWEAISHIRRAMTRASELSDDDRSFLESLKDASELHVGIIDTATYENRTLDRASKLEGLAAIQAQQEALYYRCARSADLEERARLAKELAGVTDGILHNDKASPQSKLNAKLLLLYVEGIEANLVASKNQFAADIRRQLYPEDVVGIARNLEERQKQHRQWEDQAAEALREAYNLNHPILIFQALNVCLRIHIGRLFEERFEAISRRKHYILEPVRKKRIEQLLEEGSRFNDAIGSDEGKLRLDESRLDFLEVQGELDAARTIAATTYPLALALGFDSIADRAKGLLSGDTLLTGFESYIAREDETDSDVERAGHSDAELARFAKHFFQTLDTPAARYDVVVEHLRVIRQMARERMKWCRHIVMLEDLSKSKIQEIAFSELPSRRGFCELFQYETVCESIDATAVIEAFKKTYCASCASRDPKQNAQV